MTGADIQATYFSPFMFIMYLVIIVVAMVVFYQWRWSRLCANNVKVLLVQPDGSTDTEYVPKTGNYVALKVPDSDSIRMWPINKLATVEVMYPGDGFVPGFLQKKIKMAVVDAEDWEPMLNRGSYSHRVASPDVVALIRDLAEDFPDAREDLETLANSLSTAPTRDMVASPAVLGNIMKEKVSEMAVTISKETFDRLEQVTRKLDKQINPIIFYVGMGAVVILMVIILVNVLPTLSSFSSMASGIDAIKRALGIP